MPIITDNLARFYIKLINFAAKHILIKLYAPSQAMLYTMLQAIIEIIGYQ